MCREHALDRVALLGVELGAGAPEGGGALKPGRERKLAMPDTPKNKTDKPQSDYVDATGKPANRKGQHTMAALLAAGAWLFGATGVLVWVWR
jgi:hypothetical protein